MVKKEKRGLKNASIHQPEFCSSKARPLESELHSKVVRRVRDPVGYLVFGTFGRAVGGEE